MMEDAKWIDIGPVEQLPALGARTLPVQGGQAGRIYIERAAALAGIA